MKKIIYLLVVVFTAFNMVAQETTSDILISEYCEYNQTVSDPNYFNHYIELYNGTGDSVDMSNYQLWRAMNGGGWNIDGDGIDRGPLTLRGYLHNNKTYVITRPNTVSNPISIASDSLQSWVFLNISGDDAIGLAKNNGSGTYELIDVIGTPDEDPGNYWSVAGYDNGTQNHVLVRKSGICSPNTNWTVSAGTNLDDSEWIVKDENDISDINYHTCQCNGGVGDEIIEGALKKTALFIGNSYTYYNDMPILVQRLAQSVGDTLVHSESYPGGYRLSQHYELDATQELIKATNYDYVVLQEQSQRPAIDSTLFFEYVHKFDSIRQIYSPCGETMLYMTWGRKYGDATNCAEYPDVCTYEGMDSVIRVRYLEAQEKINSLISPVGKVRNYIVNNYPDIELYISDESHPTAEGSYVSAVTFYTVMFKKDPTLTTYNFSLSDENAAIIKQVVKDMVYDKLDDWNTYGVGADASMELNITYPTSTDILSGSDSYVANIEVISSVAAVDSVVVFYDGTRLGSLSESPFSYSFSPTVGGMNNLIAVAYNSDGGKNFTRSDFYVINDNMPIEVKDSWGIIGSALTGSDTDGWNADVDMIYDESTDLWSIAKTLFAGEFKFRANDSWTLNYGDNNTDGILNQDGANIPISESGNYTITLDVTNKTYAIVLNTPTLVEENDTHAIEIYPNPAHSILNINLCKIFNNGYYEIYNISGQLIKNDILNSQNNKFDIANLSSGVYALKIKIDNKVFCQKFIKK